MVLTTALFLASLTAGSTEPGSETCFNIRTIKLRSPASSRISWTLGTCIGPWYSRVRVYVEECCLEIGIHNLTCLWDNDPTGDYFVTNLWIQGVEYRCDSRYGFSEDVTIITEPRSNNCFNITISTTNWANEMTWHLGHCAGAQQYSSHATYTEECCLEMGDYDLTCLDAYGDGYHGATITIDGVAYCRDFEEGYIYQEHITIITPAATRLPTLYSSDVPTPNPTTIPTPGPTGLPTLYPSDAPTWNPSPIPTPVPTSHPSDAPTSNPTPFPIPAPTLVPTIYPSDAPTPNPTRLPTSYTSGVPTCIPTSPYPTRVPNEDCIKTEQNWSEEIAKQLCSVKDMGVTMKGVDAVVCPDYNQYHQRRLNYSLANRAFLSCSAWCLYNAHTDGYDEASGRFDAFIWRKPSNCWEPTRTGLCIDGNTKDREIVANYINTLCWACIPSYTWDADRAKEICPGIVPANKGYGVKVCDDPTSSTKQSSLDKSLANKFFAHCSAYCVYDFDTIMSNGCSYGGFVWKQTCWKWVTGWDCFGKFSSEFRAVSSRASNLCEF